jgi:hypothetical protein
MGAGECGAGPCRRHRPWPGQQSAGPPPPNERFQTQCEAKSGRPAMRGPPGGQARFALLLLPGFRTVGGRAGADAQRACRHASVCAFVSERACAGVCVGLGDRTLSAESTMARAAISRIATSERPLRYTLWIAVISSSCDIRPASRSGASRAAASARLLKTEGVWAGAGSQRHADMPLYERFVTDADNLHSLMI